jgi:wyosine [tRNA(Phe)-imidazoG37] synthetase (radical SAM superfamily)
MPGFLFHDVIFGPVRSRRLGLSLGINLLPAHSKYCSFNCIYCECGWTPMEKGERKDLPPGDMVAEFLEKSLMELVETDYLPDAITFAGNGEPTLHPEFAEIVDDTVRLRDKYCPDAKVSILSNASMLDKQKVFDALLKLDNNIQKLDAGNEELFRIMNNPVHAVNYKSLVENLRRFNGKVIIQSLFLRGTYRGSIIDNTTPEAVEEWLQRIRQINPQMVMVYPIARATPVGGLEKIPVQELDVIAEKIKKTGLKAAVYG